MKLCAFAIAFLLVSASALCSPAGLYQPEGNFFQPKAPIAWAATNSLPKSLTVYKISSPAFSQQELSNAMSVGSFSSLNRIHAADGPDFMLFQDHRDKMEMTRYLKISPIKGWMNYYDARALGKPIKGVPSFDQVEALATNYLSRFGGDLGQLAPKPWTRSEQTVTSYDKKGGEATNKIVSMRGIFLFRQVDGIPETSSSFWIDFGNDAKPSTFELNWKTLKPVEQRNVVNTDEILSRIKQGKAVRPVLIYGETGNEDVSSATKFTITKIIPYLGSARDQKDLVCPFGKVEITAEVGKTNIPFQLDCPILSTNVVAKP
jgi:hypothetical protein